MNDRPLLERPLGEFLGRTSVQVAIVAALAVAVLFRDLDRPLTGDSVLYASISRTMVDSGNWLEPARHAEPYFNKPPVAFWLTAMSMKLFGFESRPAMLPSTLAAVALVALVYAATARAGGPVAGLLAAILLAFTPGFYRNSATCRLDSLLLLFTVLAALALERARERPAWFIAFWGLLGTAVMTKSAAGFLPLAAIALGALVLRDPFPWNRKGFYAALPVFFAVAAPWYLHMYRRFGAHFFQVHLHEQAIERFGGPNLAPPAMLRGYLAYTGACLILAPLGIRAAWRERAANPSLRRAAALATVWIAIVIGALFMLKPGAERERYTYYTLAAGAGLAGVGIASVLRDRIGAAHVAAAAAVGAIALFAIDQVAPFEKVRSSSMRDVVVATRLLAPAGDSLPVIARDLDLTDNFTRFYFARRADPIPLEKIEDGIARRGGDVLVLTDKGGLQAAKRYDPQIIANGVTFALVRIRSKASP